MMGQTFYQRTAFVYVLAFVFSIALSFWVNIHEAVINPDAICYLYSAEEIGKSGFHGAMQLCPQAIWPFYSAIIYAFEKLTNLSYLTVAFSIDALFSALSVILFIAIIQELGGSRRVLWLAAMVILFAHEFNVLRQDIIRDHGFWAFYLASLFFLLRYFRDFSWKSAFAYGMSLFIATIFRIEGAIFLLLTPFISFFFARESVKKSVQAFAMLNTPLFLVAMIVLGWLVMHPQQSYQQFGRVVEVGHQLRSGFTIIGEQYLLTKSAVAQYVLSHNSLRDAGVVVFLLLISWYFVNIVSNLSVIYTLLLIYAWFTKAASLSRDAFRVLLGYLLVNFIVTFGFFAQNHFLAKRYLIAFSLTLMLWVPFALEKLIEGNSFKQKILVRLAFLFIFISAISSVIHFGHSKDYIRRAGDWLAVNVPANAKIYANDYQLMYYSQHFGSGIFRKFREFGDVTIIEHGQWKQYDYLALLMGKSQQDKTGMVMQEIHLPPLQVFVSESGDHVYIYKVSHQEKAS